MIPTLLALLACDGEAPSAAECGLAARAPTTPIAGDANGDGVVDVADGAAIHGWLFRGGAAPACTAAADAVPDGAVDVGDGVTVWHHLFAGAALLPLAEACPASTRAEEPVCGDGLALAIDAPAELTGAGAATGTATATLVTGPLAVEALALGLRAEGCTITGASFAGTAAADRRDAPPGLRDGGFARVDVAGDALVAAVAWDIAGNAVLPASDAPVAVLAVDLSAPVGSACAPCTLTVADGPVGGGEPVTTVVGAAGFAYVPTKGSARIEVCPGP